METSPLPHPGSNRGRKNREQLLNAGLEAFARYGPEGVSTRRLAKLAGVNSAAIQYYFGSKEGYYLAVVEHLIQTRANPIRSMIADISNQFHQSGSSRPVAEQLLPQLIYNLAKIVLLNPAAHYFASISSREHLHPTKAYELFYQVVAQLHGLISELVAVILGLEVNSPEAVIRAHAILGQVLLFRIGSATLCRRLQWESITEEQAEWIASTVAEMTCRSLGLGGALEKKAQESLSQTKIPLPEKKTIELPRTAAQGSLPKNSGEGDS